MQPITSAFYRTVWRWHFYAGLFVLPLILVLSLSGSLYLFKPQVERWEERHFHDLPSADAVAPAAQVAAATAAIPGSRLLYYRLPERPGDAAMLHLALRGGAETDAFVSPQGRMLGAIAPGGRIIAIDRAIHGQLLLGPRGSWIVELAASWAIVLIATGLYLWWPRGRVAAGVIWPRWTAQGRLFWRDLHAVTGFWVSGLALVLLFTGLPWADAWGSAFSFVRTEMGWVKGAQDWTIGGRVAQPAGHDGMAMGGMAMGGMAMPALSPTANPDPALLNRIVVQAKAAHLAFPVLVIPPGMPSGEGGSGGAAKDWVVRSDAQNRPLRVTIHYDRQTAALKSRDDFATHHPIDKVIAYAVAWHEGQLFGPTNQLIGLATAAMLVTLVVSGTAMWWQRRPARTLGAPPLAEPGRLHGAGAWALLVFLLAWLPLFTASLVLLWLFERLALPLLPSFARWAGLADPHRRGAP